MKYEYKVKGVDYEVEIQDIEGNIANVTVNGIPFEVEMKQPVKAGKQKVKLGGVGSEERRVKNSIALPLHLLPMLLQRAHLPLVASLSLPHCLAPSMTSR